MIALGCDHGGFGLKNAIKQYLEENHIEYKDFGCMTEESVNYGPIAAQVARSVAGGQCEKGILCCGTGIGMSIAANKVKGIRASVCTNEFCTEMTRRHNDSNILCLGGRVISEEMAVKLAKIYLETPFDGGRHALRVQQISQIENGEL
ncbi:MAG TPA: ribose 5-phosphate isomerase B [Candidatus Caccousia avistercoris]|nr:ribose 5-phosphate isomerase B [Candidatus Caccousia avistercoris]